tara:strand:- start:1513 stop:2046 length:534 start_codon:yes stop_codon:yes gene_type:complete
MNAIEPRAWVGCLAAYNDGILHGEWLDCDDEDEFNKGLKRVLDSSPVEDAEELWVMDYEGLPIRDECSPSVALRLGLLVDEVCNSNHHAYEVLEHALDYHGGDASLEQVNQYIEDSYAGTYESEEDFAFELAVNMGQNTDGFLGNYIDWERMARDLFMCDYTSVSLKEGGVAVLRCI